MSPNFLPGGDPNVLDDDGDTPLYTVENVDTARFLVDHGALIDHRNHDGVSVRVSRPGPPSAFWPLTLASGRQPAEHLAQDFPSVAQYLLSLDPASPAQPSLPSAQPSEYHRNAASEQLTTSLLQSAHDVMQRADAAGRDPDQELRQVVGETVVAGIVAGLEMRAEGEEGDARAGPQSDDAGQGRSKRTRHDAA